VAAHADHLECRALRLYVTRCQRQRRPHPGCLKTLGAEFCDSYPPQPPFATSVACVRCNRFHRMLLAVRRCCQGRAARGPPKALSLPEIAASCVLRRAGGM